MKTFIPASLLLAFQLYAQPIIPEIEILLKKDDVIWGLDFLPQGKILFTQRSGKISIFDPLKKSSEEVKNVPPVHSVGQGGMLDIRVHPDFAKNHLIYFCYSEPMDKKSTTALGMAKLEGNELKDFKQLFSGFAPNTNDIHYGCRIEFDGDKLFLSMGERDERNKAQDLAFDQGKILRFNLDGTIPLDNPFVKNKNARPEIWSLGHRSPQGLVLRPGTHELWEAEMGPQGGDEINFIEKGKNYGWPIITYGREYSGPKIGEKSKPGLEQPITYWVPSISPSSIAFYTGDKIPQWKNNLMVGTLSGTHLRRLVLDGKKVVQQEEYFAKDTYRWRILRTGPDGYLYFGTDEGRIGRIKEKRRATK